MGKADLWGDLSKAVYSYVTEREVLNRHMRHPELQDISLDHECIVCKNKFKTEGGLNIHYAKMHIPRVEIQWRIVDVGNMEEERYKKFIKNKVKDSKCPSCNLVCKSVAAARTHWTKKHKPQPRMQGQRRISDFLV